MSTYAYPPAVQCQPHGVRSAAGSASTSTLTDDADDNMTAMTGATACSIGWTAFNLPLSQASRAR